MTQRSHRRRARPRCSRGGDRCNVTGTDVRLRLAHRRSHRLCDRIGGALLAALALGCSAAPTPTGSCSALDASCPDAYGSGPSCATDSQCGPGGFCVYGRCSVAWGPATCVGDADCGHGINPLICWEGTCVLGCRPDGETCARDLNCCSQGCEGDPPLCTTPRCNTAGETCAVAADCCSALGCTAGHCATGCTPRYATCTRSDECCSGSVCDPMLGRCMGAVATMGQACDDAAQNFCWDAGTCVGTICERDARCNGLATTCASNADCCAGFPCVSGRCHRCSARGEACTGDDQCCTGAHSCVGGTCTATGCRDWRECSPQEQCRDGACHPFDCQAPSRSCLDGSDCCSTLCVAGTCRAPTGATCAHDADCIAPDVCRADATCGAAGVAGEPCMRDAQCEAGRHCPFGTQTCTALLGEPCAASVWCEGGTCSASGHCCTDFGCVLDTDCCTTGDRCAGGRCCASLGGACFGSGCCAGTTCRGGACCLPNASTCTAPADCCSGACTGGTCGCSAPGRACGLDTDCCAPGRCSTTGGTGDCCLPSGSVCSTGTDCCSGNCRSSGRCL